MNAAMIPAFEQVAPDDRAALVHVLHVDDSVTTRMAVAAVLGDAGIEVTSTGTGGEALELAAELQPDVVLLDVQLPDLDGFEVCRRLKGDDATGHLPVLHLSETFRTLADRIRGIENGADWYLAQPVEPVELVATVRALARIHVAEQAVRAAQDRFRALVEHSTELVAVMDGERHINFASPAFEHTLKMSVSEVQGTVACRLVHPDDHAMTHAIFDDLAPGQTRTVLTRLGSDATGWRWMECVLSDLRDLPTVAGVVLNARDVTDRRAAQSLLAGQSAVLERVARSAPLQSTLTTIASFVGEHTGRPCRVHADHAAVVTTPVPEGGHLSPVRSYRSGELLGSVVVEGPVDDRIRNVASMAAGMAGIAIERDAAEHQLVHQALHDPLTDLPNRHVLLDRLSQAMARRQRSGLGLAVLFLDLDRFKLVNDSLGHSVGDELLVEIARRLSSTVRNSDTVVRLGGDEFVILCPDLRSRDEALLLADRLLATVREPVVLGGRNVRVTASCGVSFVDETSPSAERIIADADAAMYEAKERGRSRIAVFDSTATRTSLAKLEMEAALRSAIERRELIVAYQPQVHLRTGEVVGFEALARWDQPGHGPVPASQFIALAEESDLIVPLGQLVLEQACRAAASWDPAATGPRVSVNLSVRQFTQSDVPATIADVLEGTGLPAQRLQVEITESALVEEADALVEALQQIRATGVSIAIDDFGTRYSSLVYLRRFPIDEVKIDVSFVEHIDEDPADRAIVAAVISLSRELGMRTVAEGVERDAQADTLTRLGCPVGQGFLFARPHPDAPGRTNRYRTYRSEELFSDV